MKLLYCWRCRAVVPMMDEQEFAQLEVLYHSAVRGVKSHRARRNARLKETPVARLHRPVQLLYRKLSKAAGLEAPIVAPDHVLKHRLAAYGPPCTKCGLPLRTPDAKICVACGTKRAA